MRSVKKRTNSTGIFKNFYKPRKSETLISETFVESDDGFIECPKCNCVIEIVNDGTVRDQREQDLLIESLSRVNGKLSSTSNEI